MEGYHHGYLLIGDADKATTTALKMASQILGRAENLLDSHPDFSFLKTDLLGIDDARKIRENSSKKSFFGQGRVFVIVADFFSREANNALLKTFEEPAGLSYFFVVTKLADNLLETLRSRLTVLNFEIVQELAKEKRELAEKFLKETIFNRGEMIKNMASQKDKKKVLDFLDSLTFILREKLLEDFSPVLVESLTELDKTRRFVFQRGSSLKMLLDYLGAILVKF